MFNCKQEELDLAKYHFNKQEQERADDKQIACLPFGPTWIRIRDHCVLQKSTRAVMKPAMEKMQIWFLIIENIQGHSADLVASLCPLNYSTNL